jgi:hypothetical protein
MFRVSILTWKYYPTGWYLLFLYVYGYQYVGKEIFYITPPAFECVGGAVAVRGP